MEGIIFGVFSLQYHNNTIFKGDLTEDRIKLMLNLLISKQKIIKILDSSDDKNLSKAEDAKMIGNLNFKNEIIGSLDNALELYSKSMAYSPKGSQSAGLAYGNRSAVFFKINSFHDCLLDIERALENKYPNNLKAKLYLRKALCLKALHPDNQSEIDKALTEAENWLRKMEDNMQKIMEKKIKKLIEQKNNEKILFRKNWITILPKLNSENLMIPGLSDAAELKYSKKYGRHIVATRDIKPGEMLFAQKPYAQIVLPSMRYRVCWNCGEQTWSSVPCDNCPDVIYCSEKCRDEAQIQHHDLECKVIGSLISLEYRNEQMLLDMRLAVKAFKEAGNSIDNLKKMLQKIDEEKDPLKEGFTGIILDPNKFSSYYGMKKDWELPHCDSKIALLTRALTIAYFFATKSTILGKKMSQDFSILKENDNFLFLIKFLSKIMLFSENHNITIGRPFNGSNDYIPIFLIVTSATSFFNHNCDVKVSITYSAENAIAYNLCPIKKGEQIFINYGPKFHGMKKEERQKYISHIHEFTCDCRACTEDWPKELKNAKKNLLNPEIIYLNKKLYNYWFSEFKVNHPLWKREKRLLESQKDLPDIIRVIEYFDSKLEKYHKEYDDAILTLDAFLCFHGHHFLILDHFRIN